MKDRVIYLLGILLLFGVVSCNKETVPGSDSPVQITFTFRDSLKVKESTKASAPAQIVNTLSDAGSINCLCHDGSRALWNVTLSGSGNTRTTGHYWPDSNSTTYTFCLSNATINSNKTVDVTNISSKDIVCGYIGSPTPKVTNSVTLEHIFARIRSITLSPPSGYTFKDGIWSATLVYQVPTLFCMYSFVTGTFSNTSNSSAQAITSAGSTGLDIWALPGACTLTVTYRLAKDSWYSDELVVSSEGLSIAKGMINDISGTLPDNQNPTKLVFEVTVDPWPNSPTNYNISF